MIALVCIIITSYVLHYQLLRLIFKLRYKFKNDKNYVKNPVTSDKDEKTDVLSMTDDEDEDLKCYLSR